MCTSYQIVFGNKNVVEDPEKHFRFYKKRDLSEIPQSEWLYEVFKQSMNARIKATGILGFIFFVISAIYYEMVIQIVTLRKPSFKQILKYRDLILTSNNE